jgi:ATP-dependent helicase/nuclease subunit A
MTIHKSKGLQFKHVILPFAQWASSGKQDTLWLPGNAFAFNETNNGLFPVNLNKSHLACSGLSEYYEAENFASLIDLINVLYVATTRAEEGLHIFYHKKPRSKSDISKYIEEIISEQSKLTEILNQITESSFELGEIPVPEESNTIKQERIHISFSAKNNIAVKSTIQSIYNTDNFENYAIAKGSFWHKIFERIENKNDIRSAVLKQHDIGNISAPQAEIIVQQIEEWLKNPDIKRWFEGDIKIINEADIIIPNQSSKRPDRVVIHKLGTDIIDYKFGQIESNQYIQQVNEYCTLFAEMGYTNVKGYIWYPLINKIIPTNN